jgi:glycosyltransferase involved in cell wall biosynthesis
VGKISVVVNTLNEEENLPRALASVKDLAAEIVVVDMESQDRTVAVAKEFGAKVFQHPKTGYVEPARNFAIEKASNEWVLILDADEEIPDSLAAKLKEIGKSPQADFYRLPRKNINFGRWIKNSRWWPDYNIRFFKKGMVSWNEIIHSVPMTVGKGLDLTPDEKYAIIHYNYPTIFRYVERMNRYTDIQAKILSQKDYKFNWTDLVRRPTAEFLSRYFDGEGYRDGLHGLALAALQAFSEFILYLKVWQAERFAPLPLKPQDISGEIDKAKKELDWWVVNEEIKSQGLIASLPRRIFRKIFLKNG